MFILKKGHQPGVYVPLRALFLVVYQSSRRPSVCASVHTFKHDYLHNQLAYSNQILSETLLGWRKGCIRFLADWIGTLVSMATDSSHRVIMGKILLALLRLFF